MEKNEFDAKLQKLKEIAIKEVDPIEWTNCLKDAEPILISTIIAWLGSTGTRGAQYEALRDSARSILETKFTNQLISTMEKLDKSSRVLTIVGIVLTVAIGLLAVL